MHMSTVTQAFKVITTAVVTVAQCVCQCQEEDKAAKN